MNVFTDVEKRNHIIDVRISSNVKEKARQPSLNDGYVCCIFQHIILLSIF